MLKNKKILEKSVILALLFLSFGWGKHLEASSVPPADANAGVLLNQNREILREQEISRELSEEQKQSRRGMEAPQTKPLESEESEVTFRLNDLILNESLILSKAEITAIRNKYIGKDITVKELYEMVNAMNRAYKRKGYIVCRAILPPQDISKGIVRIVLVEGKTGDIFIDGNKTTNENYIKNQILLESGEVSNFNELNRSLIRFNGVNDIQMRIEMKAGKIFSTTDYLLNIYEPPKHQFSIFADNAGSETTGEYRGGISYGNASLFGSRDALQITGVGTQGTRAGAFSYSFPIGRKGTRMGLQFSMNHIEIIDGELKDVDVKGKSYSYGINFTHPFLVTENRKIEGAIEFSKQKSITDFMGFRWVDDDITHVSASLTFRSYGKNSIWYNRHSLTYGNWKSLSGTGKNYFKYELLSIYQRVYQKGRTLTLKFNGQYASRDYLPSADQFFVGGTYSVRGYKENFMGADEGVMVSAEYSIPVHKRGEIFVFADGGYLHGENAWEDHQIYGVGAGFKVNLFKDTTVSVTVGFPLKKEISNAKVDSHRIYASFNHRF
jgi:hemolysin activation/secretion protein